MMRTLLVVFLVLSAAPAGAARWDTYNNANRLNSVRAVSGTVWTASDLGLHRFEPGPSRFTRIAKSTGALASNSIDEVETDGTGTWFGTKGRGVSVQLANGAWRTLNTFDGLPSDTVTALEPSPAGMWVATRKGLALFDGFTLTAVWPDGVNPSPFNSNVINDVAHVGDSTYIATIDGAYVTKTSEGVTWSRRVAGLVNRTVGAIKGYGNEVWCISGGRVYRGGQTGTWTLEETGLGGATPMTMTAREGQLFIGGSNGVYRWDGVSSWQVIGSGFPAGAWVDVDPSGTLWAGNPEGLWRWNGTGWLYYRAPGPSGNWVQGMALTGSTLWFTTRDLGMTKFDGTTWRNYFPTTPYGVGRDTTFFIANTLFGLLPDRDGTVWAGQWGQSVAHVNGSGEPPSFDHFWDPAEENFDARNTFLWSTALDPQGNRYFGYDTPLLGVITPVGINRIGTDGSRTNFSPPAQAMSGPQIRAIAFAPGQTWEMWVAYARLGVDVFTDPTLNTRLDHLQTTRTENAVVIPGLLSLDTWAIEFNGDDVWIGDSNGLTRWSRTTRKRLEAVSTPPPSTQGAIHPLSIDAEGGVWWATASGLFHRKSDRSVEVFTEENSPLLSNDVHSVIVDKATGDVWIGTVLGINRYNPAGATGGPTVADGSSFHVYPNPAFQSAAGVFLRTNDLTGPFKGKVFDVHGRVVRKLLGNATTGILWDGLNESGSRVPPGVYFLRVEAGNVTRKSRVLLFR